MKGKWIWMIALVHGLLLAQQPGDLNGDGVVTDEDSLLLSQALVAGTTPGPGSDCNLDGNVDYLDVICTLNRRSAALLVTSPGHLETGVAVTRETRLLFSLPLDPTTTSAAITVTAGGETPSTTVHLSQDGTTLTLFYPDNLPEGTLVTVTLNGDVLRTVHDVAVDVDGDGIPGGSLSFDFETLGLDLVAGTAVTGRVFASEVAFAGKESLDVGLAGVSITVDGAEGTLFTSTDSLGNFRLDPAPSGRFFVHIDGRGATGVPAGDYYPFVGKAWQAIAGRESSVGNVYLPLIRAGTLLPVSETVETEITFPASVVAEQPELAGTSLTVPPDSLFADDGSRGGFVGIAPVDPSRLPGTLPTTLPLPLVITVQTDGATNFDAPVAVCFPNLPDPITGELAVPGSASALVSFNHDSGRFEVVGAMTVSDDGTQVCSNPGSGILAPGWHGARAGTSGGGGNNRGGDNDNDDDDDDDKDKDKDQDDKDREDKEEKGQEDTPPSAPPNSNSDSPNEDCPKKDDDDVAADDPVDPVYLFSGEFYHKEVDLRIRGRGFDFVWARKYRAQLATDSAMGNSWDFSYNIKVKRANCGDLNPSLCPLILYDGNTRRDRYRVGIDGNYDRDEFFRTIVENPDTSFTLTFANKGIWQFLPLNGSPSQGKVSSIADRNGNTMAFQYDGVGRLSTIIDTLGRSITVAYASGSADARIQTLTDFSGRVVSYDFYDGTTPEGNAGDLKSCTSPAVTGTPNGNDFPDGKTTSYTYLKVASFALRHLRGNLLTITDGRRNDPNDPTFGQGPWLINSYDRSDRLVKQVWGGDIVDVYYNRVFPSRANGMAVKQTIVNDRKGHVKEYWWDRRNRCVLKREYTGTADPTQPTTFFSNLPTGKLRPEDPDYYETRYFWNMDSLKSRVVHPNGNITEYVYERDLNPDGPSSTRGNLRILRHLPGPLGGDQDVIEEAYTYDTDFGGGGCCGFNFVTSYTDGRGNTVTYDYDSNGNLTSKTERIASIQTDWQYNGFGQMTQRVLPDNGSGHRRSDVFTYYATGPQRGYPENAITDAPNLALTTTFEYDSLGRTTRIIDPRGHDSLRQYNSLDQVIRKISKEVTDGSGIRYERDYFYDANNNLTRFDVQNLDDQGVLQPNTHFTTTLDYEILNRLIRRTQEVEEAHDITNEYEYDGNRNRVLIRFGEAVNGNQPANVKTFIYDERDLLFLERRAPGTALQASNQFDYDLNGNLVRRVWGMEGEPRIYHHVFDGYNRRVENKDALGNRELFQFDANHNMVRYQFLGEVIDLPGDRNNVRLSDTAYTYDGLNRSIRRDTVFFDIDSQALIDDGLATAQWVYSDHSQLLESLDDHGHRVIHSFDTANRIATVTDEKNNRATFTYDANANIVSVNEVNKSDLGEPDEVFFSSVDYDNLDRRIVSSDNAANRIEFAFDSRGNVTQTIDALRPDNENDPGNRRLMEYDGLNRRTRIVRQLTDDGTGTGLVIGSIVQTHIWDDSNRQTIRIDDNGNRTEIEFDALNRRGAIVYADGTRREADHDVRDFLVEVRDANGTRVRFNRDLLNRIISKTITPGTGVSDETTFAHFKYDGLSRVVFAEDNDSLVTRSFNSLFRVTRETLNGQTTTVAYDGVGNCLGKSYPSGRNVSKTYDSLNRGITISDTDGLVATYQYVGPFRTASCDLGNNTRMEIRYDDVKRISRISHTFDPENTPQTFDDRRFTWDRMYNKTSRTDELLDETHTFSYDSTYRLGGSNHLLNGQQIDEVGFSLDTVGNRLMVTGGLNPGLYTMSSDPIPDDFQMNQYTTTPFGARQYDENGNLVSAELGNTLTEMTHNYQNLMVTRVDDESTTHYRYDAFGRRVEKQVDRLGQIETVRYFYDGWHVIEEQDENGNELAGYIYGRHVDEVLKMVRDGDAYYYHADDMFNVLKVTDASGAVVEQYNYETYGKPFISNALGQPLSRSAINNPYLFTGRRFDEESGYYYSRNRYFEPATGKFTTRDPVGIWGDSLNMGNGYTYAGNNPWTLSDPFGLVCTGDPRLDDPDIRKALQEAWKRTSEDAEGKDYPKWHKGEKWGPDEWFFESTGRETHFSIQQNITPPGGCWDYYATELEIDPPNGGSEPFADGRTQSYVHCHIDDSPNGAVPYDRANPNLKSGDKNRAKETRGPDYLVGRDDPNDPNSVIVRPFHFGTDPTNLHKGYKLSDLDPDEKCPCKKTVW